MKWLILAAVLVLSALAPAYLVSGALHRAVLDALHPVLLAPKP